MSNEVILVVLICYCIPRKAFIDWSKRLLIVWISNSKHCLCYVDHLVTEFVELIPLFKWFWRWIFILQHFGIQLCSKIESTQETEILGAVPTHTTKHHEPYPFCTFEWAENSPKSSLLEVFQAYSVWHLCCSFMLVTGFLTAVMSICDGLWCFLSLGLESGAAHTTRRTVVGAIFLGAYQIFKMPSLEIRVSTVTHFERSARYFPSPSSRSSLGIQDPLGVFHCHLHAARWWLQHDVARYVFLISEKLCMFSWVLANNNNWIYLLVPEMQQKSGLQILCIVVAQDIGKITTFLSTSTVRRWWI